MKPICVPCQRFYRPRTNGVFFLEGMPKGENVGRGLREPAKWKPYKLWSGDLWFCPDCEAEIIVGTGAGPISEHFQPDFQSQLEAYKPKVQINDC